MKREINISVECADERHDDCDTLVMPTELDGKYKNCNCHCHDRFITSRGVAISFKKPHHTEA